MKVLVTGASGLLGRRVFRKLKDSQLFDLIGTCFSRTTNTDLVKLDITDEKLLGQWFQQHKPEAIVHCAAERRPDVVEKDPNRAEQVNVEGTRLLCSLAEKSQCWMLYISTDYVFDGKNAPYKEGDTPNPLNTYGKTKLAGEQVVLGSTDKNAVLRVPILYGPIEYLGESAVTVLYSSVSDSSTQCLMDHRQRRYPTHTDTVAHMVFDMLLKHQQEQFSLSGIYHLSDSPMLTKYDMAIAMAEAMTITKEHINANTAEPRSTDTPRPYDCQLLIERIQQAGLSVATKDFKTEIRTVLSDYLTQAKLG